MIDMRRKPSLKIGDLFRNQYEVQGVLGAGGHAFVYRVYDQILARELALKLIEISPDAASDRRRRARNEAQALCRLKHPNLVGGEGAGVTDDGSVFILMKLLRGPSLRTVLDEHRKVHLMEALIICEQIAEGVHVAHQHNIVHRDLKPENVIIESGNRACVIDLGISKFDSPDAQTTQRALVQGTTWYMSPEHIQGLAVTPCSDIFALGTIFYELVAGIRPTMVDLEVVDANTINHRLLYIMPRYLDEIVRGVPPYVADFVQSMLAKNPDGRPESMALVANMFREFRARLLAKGGGDANKPVRDLAVSTAEKAQRWEHQHTTRPAEPFQADPATSELAQTKASQRALPIASVVHAEETLDTPQERGATLARTPQPSEARDSAQDSSRAVRSGASQAVARISSVEPPPHAPPSQEPTSGKHTLRFGSVETQPASPAAAQPQDVPASAPAKRVTKTAPTPTRERDSGRRVPTVPGYAREIPPLRAKSSPLSGVMSDPLWTRVVAAAVLTGSVSAVVLVSAGLKFYRATRAASEAAAYVAERAPTRESVATPIVDSVQAEPPNAVDQAPTFTSARVSTEEQQGSLASSLGPAFSAQIRPKPPTPSLATLARSKPSTMPVSHSSGANAASTASSVMDTILVPPLRGAPPLPPATPDQWAMPSSGLEEPSKRPTTTASPKRAAPSASPEPSNAPARDKSDRVNLIFPPR